MAWSNYQKFLAGMMVVTGSINTLCTKWADKLESQGSDGYIRPFEHPFLQAAAMFLGEMLCLMTFKFIFRLTNNNHTGHMLVQGNQNFNPFILMPAAMFDLVATSLMYIGLTLTYASSFQMCRGSVIIFVAMLSMTFLNRIILKREWLGIVCVIIGLLVVGATDAIFQGGESKGPNSIITGDLLIIVAQVVTACQMVYEEKYVSSLNIPPLQAVGWEGVFGFSVLSCLLVIFYWVPAPPHFGHNARGTVEDAIDGLVQIVLSCLLVIFYWLSARLELGHQARQTDVDAIDDGVVEIGNNPLLMSAVLGTVVSIAFFNFAGISVTKEMSATTRMVLDSIRTFVIWMFSLAVRWQAFHWPHLLGFAVLILGTAQYNGLIPDCRRRRDTSTPVVDTAADSGDEGEA